MEVEENTLNQQPVTDLKAQGPGFFGLLLYLYFFIALFIAFPYFNYQYARQNGFFNWLFLGELVPTAQSFIWPYYLLNSKTKESWSESEKANLRHFHESDNAARKVQFIAKRANASNMTQADIREYLSLSKLALKEAKLVDPQVLAKAHPELPYHYQNEYIASFELYHQAIEGNMGMAAQLRSRKLWNDWSNWFNENVQDIHMPKQR